jgi:hypothetical protein
MELLSFVQEGLKRHDCPRSAIRRQESLSVSWR